MHIFTRKRLRVVPGSVTPDGVDVGLARVTLSWIPGLVVLWALSACGSDAHVSWPEAPPEDRGLSASRLERLAGQLADSGTRALLLARDGALVLEWYAPDFGPERTHYAASVAKSIVGGLSFVLALGDGRVVPEDSAARWIAAWRDDPMRARITLRHLAAHSSGLPNGFEIPPDERPDWARRFWSRDGDPFRVTVHDTPMLFPPGERFFYSSPGYAALGIALTAAYRESETPDLRVLLRERIFRPLGVPDAAWVIGYGRTVSWEGLRLVPAWGGCNFTPRALARLGQLLLDGGRLEGRALLDAEWLRRATSEPAGPAEPEPHGSVPGLGFWLNRERSWPSLPADAYAAAGAEHQLLVVIPSWRVVAVRMGKTLDPEGSLGFWEAIERHFLRPLGDALTPSAPKPPRPPRSSAVPRWPEIL